MILSTEVQWKPLNVITLGQRESDNINRMMAIRSKVSNTQFFVTANLGQFDHIN